MNYIQTWKQGYFVDQKQYSNMSQEWKDKRQIEESYLVRPRPTDNALCSASTPENAKWIANRLNLASKLEQMTYDYATGKNDGKELVAFVKSNFDN